MRAVSLVQMPEVWRVAVVLAAALAIAFVLGGAAGYSLRGLEPVAASAPSALASPMACPSRTHAVVYYTGHAWSCVPD